MSGMECYDNFDMGSGQSVHLVVEMWRDIPLAKLRLEVYGNHSLSIHFISPFFIYFQALLY